jgi:hypothetical protein
LGGLAADPYPSAPQRRCQFTFEGTGKQITEAFTLESGLRIIRVEFPQSSFLIVHLLDNATGDKVDSLFSEYPAEGEDTRTLSQGFQVDTSGTFRLNIDASSVGWKITIE